MALTIGARLGPYEVLAKIGEGGMGEVYRARDSRLNRDVAIKVLARTDADPGPQRRLLDEAQAASALNHPNIVAVYDVGTAEGVPFIVSELVAGTSLRAIVSRAPLPIREVLDLAVQMADGLAAAHQAGIAHRDFKPENVMVTAEGRVKILDFGLARRAQGAKQEDALTVTLSSAIVGTVPYMSPEQARGAAVDYRTDQFSLGLTLYELLTGRRAFSGDSAAQLLAAIIEDEPEPIGKVNPRVPVPLRWTIERCLRKDSRQRYDATADLARELHTLRERLGEFVATPDDASVAVRDRRRLVMRAVAGVIAAVLIAVTAATVRPGDDTSRALDRYRFTPFATDAGYQNDPAWSPDGKTLAYVAEADGTLQVFTKNVGSPLRAQVTQSPFDCRDPLWSPDGTRLYYTSLARDRDGLWSITAVGGAPELVLEGVSRASLSPDGKTLGFVRAGGTYYAGAYTLWLSSPPGAAPVQYKRATFGSQEYRDATLRFSPDGSKIGVWVVTALAEERGKRVSEFWVLPLHEGEPAIAPAPEGSGLPFAAPFSWLPDNQHVVEALPAPRPGVHLWISDTRQGSAHLVTSGGGFETSPAVSPDGNRLAMAFQQADYDVYQLSIDHPSPAAFLATSRNEMDPAWSAAVSQLVFTTDRDGSEAIWLRSQDGSFERPLVTGEKGSAPTELVGSPAFSPDGQRVAYYREGAQATIWISPVAGGPPVQLTEEVDRAQDSPNWSPDGAWIGFVQGQGGKERWDLVKMRVGARSNPQVLHSNVIPYSPVRWSPDGGWIAVNSFDGLTIASSDGQSRRVVHEQPWMSFAWSADSRRLYGIRQSDDSKHLTFTSVEIGSGVERILNANVMPLPVAAQPVRGFTRMNDTTFLTSIARVRSDIWLLDGFNVRDSFWERTFKTLRLMRP